MLFLLICFGLVIETGLLNLPMFLSGYFMLILLLLALLPVHSNKAGVDLSPQLTQEDLELPDVTLPKRIDPDQFRNTV